MDINVFFEDILRGADGIKVMGSDERNYSISLFKDDLWDEYLNKHREAVYEAQKAKSVSEAIRILKVLCFYFDGKAKEPIVRGWLEKLPDGTLSPCSIVRDTRIDTWVKDKITDPIRIRIERLEELKSLFPDDSLQEKQEETTSKAEPTLEAADQLEEKVIPLDIPLKEIWIADFALMNQVYNHFIQLKGKHGFKTWCADLAIRLKKKEWIVLPADKDKAVEIFAKTFEFKPSKNYATDVFDVAYKSSIPHKNYDRFFPKELHF